MQTSVAQNLKDAYNAFDPTKPLNGDEPYYVPRGGGVDGLIGELRDDERQATKILFTGHRGSGKSTELRRLSHALRDTYFVVYFDADETLDIADLDYKDVLVTLGVKLYQMARQRQLAIDPQVRQRLLGWYQTVLNETSYDTGASDEGELKVDTFFLRLVGKLKAEAHTRKTIRTQVESQLSDLIYRINELCAAITAESGRRILVVIDGLDRLMQLDKALRLFHENNTPLISPDCKIIYTVPLAIFYTKEMGQVRVTFDKDFLLPNLKPFDRAGQPHAERALLEEVIRRRMSADLITPAAVTRLGELSGGLFRELTSLTKDAVANARSARAPQVDVAHVEKAAHVVRNRYRGMLTLEDRAELLQRHADKQKINSPITQSLLHSLSLLEYVNDESWYDVHPLLWALLDEWR